ncbi:MAG: hypothetical protein OXH84_02785 [Gammaproteobacteria bacterium]|nr:hypothetical protein [Gammaproteobacteria bacterium]
MLNQNLSEPDVITFGLGTLRERPKQERNESEVRRLIIDPVLPIIFGIDIRDIVTEYFSNNKIPDYVIKNSSGWAPIFIEAKVNDVDITRQRQPDEPLDSTPMGQLSLYLENHELSRDGSIGFLSNGYEWVAMRRGRFGVREIDRFEAGSIHTLKECVH